MAAGMKTPSPGASSTERRQAPRVDHRVPLGITGEGTTLQTETVNLSAAGVYCTLDRFLAPMTKLQLDYEVPDGARRVRIRCTGVVVRAEPVIANADRGRYHIAIFFTDLSDRDRSVLSRFVQQHLARPSTS